MYALGRVLAVLLDAPAPTGAPAAAARVPAALRSIVARATAEDPAQRYAGVDGLAADVRRHLDGERVRAHRESVPERLARALAPHRVAIGLVLAYIVTRALVFWVYRR